MHTMICMATLATTEYIYYLHDSDDVLMVGLENRQTIARGGVCNGFISGVL